MSTEATVRLSRRLYLDTSAYLCILLGEDGAADLSAETDAAELMTSVLIRLARDGALNEEQPIDRFVTLDASQAQAAKALGLPV